MFKFGIGSERKSIDRYNFNVLKNDYENIIAIKSNAIEINCMPNVSVIIKVTA